ncbi:hypothetical protein BC643_0757 [Mangrovibacterium diazotrophicum]|uniref:Uncharacterized protein n=1 Tax=Mangrovibacterium diazotrophicum TaxID=1261403 RepID=A0A419W4N0_9BACT|nr:hypothetical protein BC643_0757 [Mangrovibacterium diazotrophicum]
MEIVKLTSKSRNLNTYTSSQNLNFLCRLTRLIFLDENFNYDEKMSLIGFILDYRKLLIYYRDYAESGSIDSYEWLTSKLESFFDYLQEFEDLISQLSLVISTQQFLTEDDYMENHWALRTLCSFRRIFEEDMKQLGLYDFD